MKYKFIKRIFAIIIVFTIVFFTGRNVVALFVNFIEEDTSIFSIVRSQFCIKKVYIPEDLSNKNLIVLRLDDVQAYSWRDISTQMIRDAYKFNAPTVA